ncbi:MAG TPA: MurT ligase domain-containing protein [bacterium]|nr:MurT ligase domain-containing protein [bacterium]
MREGPLTAGQPPTLRVRLSVAVALGKATAMLSRALRRGGGTTMPGRVARAVEPAVVGLLSARLPLGSVVIAGTNGKTTTAHLLAHIMRSLGHRPVHNRAGANLAAGIASALVENADLLGRLRGDLGIFEVDEATVPRVVPALGPRVAVFLNLFRDQLDRYGEIDYIAGLWRSAGAALSPDLAAVANADDPLVFEAVRELPGTLVTFGIEDDRYARPALEHTAEARYCYRCGTAYAYEVTYFGHMGRWRCVTCGVARPSPDLAARDLVLSGPDGSEFTIDAGAAGTARVRTVLPGLYNVYNVLAAVAAAGRLGASLGAAASAVGSVAPAFGRAERVSVDGREVRLLLVKNPAGFNEVLRVVLAAGPPAVLLIAINDRTADGRDVSWLWDVDVEMLAGRVGHVVVTGIRAEDMALRLQYAGIPPEAIEVEHAYDRALRRALDRAAPGGLFVLPTYTAMLALRGVLQQWGAVRGFWET